MPGRTPILKRVKVEINNGSRVQSQQLPRSSGQSPWQGPGDRERRIAGRIKSARLWGPPKHPEAGKVTFRHQVSDPRHAPAFSRFLGLSRMDGSNGSNHPGKLSDLGRSMTRQPGSGAFGEGELGPEHQTEFLAGTVTNDWRQRRPFATRKIKGPRATHAGLLANAKSAMASVRYQARTGADRTVPHPTEPALAGRLHSWKDGLITIVRDAR